MLMLWCKGIIAIPLPQANMSHVCVGEELGEGLLR